jgi:hypothetical protein|tara:strand:- start:2287 stop:2406 length:120 start_codon:yes stop_codon:yes gene_type:complete
MGGGGHGLVPHFELVVDCCSTVLLFHSSFFLSAFFTTII